MGCFYLHEKEIKKKSWKWLEKKIPLHFFLLFLFFLFSAIFLISKNQVFSNNNKFWLASVVSFPDSDRNLNFNGNIELQPAKLPLSNNIVYKFPLASNKELPKEENSKPQRLAVVKKSSSRVKSKLEKSDYPDLALVKEEYKNGKYIEVDLQRQVMAVYGSGELKGLYQISTGMPGMRTPTGNFKVLRKSANVWSAVCGCWMPYAMEFKSGLFIHELPYWPGKGREGETHLGQPVSHGCVRLGIGPAQEVFEFAEIGTPVIIHQ